MPQANFKVSRSMRRFGRPLAQVATGVTAGMHLFGNPQYLPDVPVGACVSVSRMRNDRPAGVITILPSRASQPMAQSKIGGLPFTSFFNCASDNSPLVLSACQRAPAVMPISSCIALPFSFRRKACKRTVGARLWLSSVRKVRCDSTPGPEYNVTVDEFQLDCKSVQRPSTGHCKMAILPWTRD